MEDKLNDLKNILNENIIIEKDIRFTDDHKKSVLNTIHTNTLRSKAINTINKKIHLFATAFITSILLIGTYYISGIDDLLNKGEVKPLNDNHSSKQINPSTKELPQNTVISPSPQEENYKEMTKDDIYKKLLSSNKFETAKGEFNEHYEYANGEAQTFNIQYVLSGDSIVGGYAIESFVEDNSEVVNTTYYKEDKMWDLDSISKTYREIKYKGSPPIARSSLFPREITLNYLKEFSNWEIENQNEEVLNHNTIVIKGVLNEYASEKHSSNTFRFWIDKDTGILLKYETYNNNNEVVNYLHTKELHINIPIDTKLFTPKLDGYEKRDIP